MSNPTPRYQVYGVTLATDFEFATPLRSSDRAPELEFGPEEGSAREADDICLLESSILLEDGQPRLTVHQGSKFHRVHFTGVADFYLRSNRIGYRVLDPAYEFMVEFHFLGLIMSLWLARQGVLALHASAAAVSDHAIAFLASNKGGKSSLAMSVVEQGNQMLSDDLLALRHDVDGFVAAPSFPQARMWPDLAAHFFGSTDHLERFHPEYDKLRVPIGPDGVGVFCDAARPIKVIYLPERRSPDAAIEIEPIPMALAAMELQANTFGIRSVEVITDRTARMRQVVELLNHVEVKRLRFPSGLHHLPEVAEAVLLDSS